MMQAQEYLVAPGELISAYVCGLDERCTAGLAGKREEVRRPPVQAPLPNEVNDLLGGVQRAVLQLLAVRLDTDELLVLFIPHGAHASVVDSVLGSGRMGSHTDEWRTEAL
ncbi:hypothetical protein GCM10010470_02200 [Saccharopolyspora taberi]|uniref:Uncharacterized protein n=1 Tax=Saccharopolyspora taberi TaxID=60895 RepID=A0ABN3V0Q0_9PSEU